MGNTQTTPGTDGLQKINERVTEVYKIQAAELTTVRKDQLLLANNLAKKRMQVYQRDLQLKALEDQVQKLKLGSSKSATKFTEEGEGERCTQSTQTDLDHIFFSEENARIALESRFRTPYIPYSPGVIETWFHTLIKRSREAEPPGNPYIAYVEMYNCHHESYNMESIIYNKMALWRNSGYKIYLHATDAGSVKNILENGIDLTKSFRNVDFSYGKGFYVHVDIAKAVQWSYRVAKWMKSKGAIIAFKINPHLQNEQPNLSLNAYNNTDMKLWQCIVSHFRHEARSPDVTNILRGVKFISGPVAINKVLDSQEIPQPFPFTQLCICDDDYAKRFGCLQNIAFVIFS